MKCNIERNKNVIDREKIADYMSFIVETYPNGCAAINWSNQYLGILKNNRLPYDYEIENIIRECLDEFEYEDLGLCGCGIPEYTREVIRQILTIQSACELYEERQKQYSELCNSGMENENYYGLIHFVLYILDDKDFLEHGCGISSAWLTKKGSIYLNLLNMNREIELSRNELE